MVASVEESFSARQVSAIDEAAEIAICHIIVIIPLSEQNVGQDTVIGTEDGCACLADNFEFFKAAVGIITEGGISWSTQVIEP